MQENQNNIRETKEVCPHVETPLDECLVLEGSDVSSTAPQFNQISLVHIILFVVI